MKIHIQFSNEFYLFVPLVFAGILLLRRVHRLLQETGRQNETELSVFWAFGCFGYAVLPLVAIFWPDVTASHNWWITAISLTIAIAIGYGYSHKFLHPRLSGRRG